MFSSIRNILMLLSLACLNSFDVRASNHKNAEVLFHEAQELIARYDEYLFPYSDPFATVFNLELGQSLYNAMLVEPVDHELEIYGPSSLFHIKRIQKTGSSGEEGAEFSEVEGLLRKIEEDLDRSYLSRMNKQSNLLALNSIANYLSRFFTYVNPTEEEGKNKDKKTENDGKNKDEKSPEEKNKRRQPPRLPKRYQPKTNEIDKNKKPGSKEDQYLLAEVNFETPFFGSIIYADISKNGFQEIDLPREFPSHSHKRGSQEKNLRVYSLGEQEFDLYLPPLYKPLDPNDPRASVVPNKSGGYQLKFRHRGDIVEIIDIPLVKATESRFLGDEVYTSPVGFDWSEGPGELQDILADLPIDQHPLVIAQKVSDHISGDYLYSVDPTSDKTPLDALNKGAFQCDMAAWAMAGILRIVTKFLREL